MAFELRANTLEAWLTTGHGQKPPERTVAARHQERVLEEIAKPNAAWVCRKMPPYTSLAANIETVHQLMHRRGIGINEAWLLVMELLAGASARIVAR